MFFQCRPSLKLSLVWTKPSYKNETEIRIEPSMTDFTAYRMNKVFLASLKKAFFFMPFR